MMNSCSRRWKGRIYGRKGGRKEREESVNVSREGVRVCERRGSECL